MIKKDGVETKRPETLFHPRRTRTILALYDHRYQRRPLCEKRLAYVSRLISVYRNATSVHLSSFFYYYHRPTVRSADREQPGRRLSASRTTKGLRLRDGVVNVVPFDTLPRRVPLSLLPPSRW